MTFTSKIPYIEPNVAAYEAQKHLVHIDMRSTELHGHPSLPPLPAGLHGNGTLHERWNSFYALRLLAAAQGDRLAYTSLFPGHTVPGPNGTGTVYRGALAVERFEKMLELHCMNFWGDPRPEHRRHPLEPSLWFWQNIPQPELTLLEPFRSETALTVKQRNSVMEALRAAIAAGVNGNGVPSIRKMFAKIRRAWNPFGEAHVWQCETLEAARELLERFRSLGSVDWMSLAFELEACLFHIEASARLDIQAYGTYRGTWLEVGRLSLAHIKATELVQTGRVLTELVSIRTRGFAPVIVNEFGCDTDGSHRLTATWLWNLLHAWTEWCKNDGDGMPPDRTWNLDIDYHHDRRFVECVSRFLESHQHAMGPLMVREALRCLQEMVMDVGMRQVLCEEVVRKIDTKPIEHLPVLLLPEHFAGTVLKGPYDAGEGIYRVDPTVYEVLAREPSYTLPARGRYHLTDRAILRGL